MSLDIQENLLLLRRNHHTMLSGIALLLADDGYSRYTNLYSFWLFAVWFYGGSVV